VVSSGGVAVIEFVAEVGERIRFAVGIGVERGADSGPQVRGYQALADERGMEPADFPGQLREVIDQARDGRLALLADSHDGEFERYRAEDFFKVDLELGGAAGCVACWS
jgi:hypothetical protein